MALFLCGQSALRNAQGGGNGIRTDTDEYGRIRTGLWLSDSHALRKFKSTWHSVCHVLPSPYYSVHIRTYPYRHCPQYRLCSKCLASQQYTQPCAPEIQKHMALSMPCAHSPYSSVSVRTRPYPSSLRYAVASRHCPQYRLCSRLRFATPRQAKCLASQQYTPPPFLAHFICKKTQMAVLYII